MRKQSDVSDIFIFSVVGKPDSSLNWEDKFDFGADLLIFNDASESHKCINMLIMNTMADDVHLLTKTLFHHQAFLPKVS